MPETKTIYGAVYVFRRNPDGTFAARIRAEVPRPSRWFPPANAAFYEPMPEPGRFASLVNKICWLAGYNRENKQAKRRAEELAERLAVEQWGF